MLEQQQADANQMPAATIKEIERKHVAAINDKLVSISRKVELYKGGTPNWDRCTILGSVSDCLSAVERVIEQ